MSECDWCDNTARLNAIVECDECQRERSRTDFAVHRLLAAGFGVVTADTLFGSPRLPGTRIDLETVVHASRQGELAEQFDVDPGLAEQLALAVSVADAEWDATFTEGE